MHRPRLVVAAHPSPDPALRQVLREVRAIREADVVVVGRVVRVHPSPGTWCGTVATRQQVTYAVDRVVHGELTKAKATKVTVGHMLVATSPLVSEHAPFLRPDHVYPGARALLFLNREEGGNLVVLDETYGARLLDAPRGQTTAVSPSRSSRSSAPSHPAQCRASAATVDNVRCVSLGVTVT